MQIDFHHAVTYVTARIAGFSHDDADIIAYSAQYVDDATSSGAVVFENKALYTRISSAHKTTDVENLNDVENHVVWLPFHFLPGNGGLAAGQSPQGTFINKLVCKPNSQTAQDMLDAAFAQFDKPNGLHRLGITMHVYADTWAHQEFAGVLHEINEVDNAQELGDTDVFDDLGTFLFSKLNDAIPPLGHGRANIFPDMPFLKWQYENGQNATVTRDNTQIFCDAADALCKAMQRFKNISNPGGINAADLSVMRGLFNNLAFEEADKRHAGWLDAIAAGKFSFGKATISYDPVGRNSWKAQSLGTSRDLPVHTYKPEFLDSNWRKFHDALQQHRLSVLHDILPKYGICAG